MNIRWQVQPLFGISPEKLGAKEIRAYQPHVVKQARSWSNINQVSCASRFLFGIAPVPNCYRGCQKRVARGL